MLKEIINRFKRLNKDSKNYLQKKQTLEKRYQYLSIFSPLPKEKQINEKVFLVDKDGNILIPYKFENIYHKGKVKLVCKKFNCTNYEQNKETFCSLTLEELNKFCYEINLKEAMERIKTTKISLISEFDRTVDFFLRENDGGK